MTKMKNEIPAISIVVPVYGCEKVLFVLHERICNVLKDIDKSFEIILVHDGASLKAWEVIQCITEIDSRVTGIKLSRNFGQHYAITAGVDIMKGNWLVVMDCDLQDRPEEIVKFWNKAQQGHDVVIGQRLERQDSVFKRYASKMFHELFSYMTDQESDATQANYGIYSRKVVDDLKRLPEFSRCFPLLVRWLGFETATVVVEHDRRQEGKTSYNLSRLVSLAVDVIVSYSNKPLKLFINAGFLTSLISTIFGCILFLRYFLYDQPVQGWTSVMVSLFFLSGVNLLGMGILGIYVGRIFNQVKGRPLYIVDTIIGNNRESNEQS